MHFACPSKVDRAESSSLSAPRNGGHRPSQSGGGGQDEEGGGLLPGGGVEPRLAKLEDDGGGDTGPRHPSAAVARDSYARERSASELGHDAAARLLQSRYRGYRLRKRGGVGGVESGTSSHEEEEEEEEEEDGRQLYTTRPAAGSSGMDAECSVLDLEVRYSSTALQQLYGIACGELHGFFGVCAVSV